MPKAPPSGELASRSDDWEGSPLRKEFGKKMSKSVDKIAGVWYYTWAPSAETKEWLLKSQLRSERKEPIDAERFQSVLRNRKRSKFRMFEMLRKKCLTKNHFCDKIIKSSAGRLRRTGPWKLNNIEKLVTEPIFVLEKHVKQFQTKVIHTGRKRLRAERNKI